MSDNQTGGQQGDTTAAGALRSLEVDLASPPRIGELPVTDTSSVTGSKGQRVWAADAGRRQTFEVTLRRSEGDDIVERWNQAQADEIGATSTPPQVTYLHLYSGLLDPDQGRARVEAFYRAFGGDPAPALAYLADSVERARRGEESDPLQKSFTAPTAPEGLVPSVRINVGSEPLDVAVSWDLDWPTPPAGST